MAKPSEREYCHWPRHCGHLLPLETPSPQTPGPRPAASEQLKYAFSVFSVFLCAVSEVHSAGQPGRRTATASRWVGRHLIRSASRFAQRKLQGVIATLRTSLAGRLNHREILSHRSQLPSLQRTTRLGPPRHQPQTRLLRRPATVGVAVEPRLSPDPSRRATTPELQVSALQKQNVVDIERLHNAPVSALA